MLAQFGLSPEALLDISAAKHGPFSTRLAWDALIEVLQSHGALLLTSGQEMRRITEIVKGKELTVDEKKRLMTLISKLKKENRIDFAEPPLEKGLANVSFPGEIEELQASLPLVAILPDEAFMRLFPKNTSGTAELDSDTEAVIGQTVSHSSVLKKMQEVIDSQNFPLKTSREKVWDELFGALASRSKRVTICDRYLLSELSRRDSFSTSAQSHDPEHLVWFLSKLDSVSPPGTRVTLLTQLESPKNGEDGLINADSVLDIIDRHWSPAKDGRLVQIEVYGVEWRSKLHPHNRHVRFGESLGYKLDEGLDRLATPSISYKAGFSYAYAWKQEQLKKLRADERLILESPDVDYGSWDLTA